MEENFEKKQGDFGRGLLVGIVCTLAIVAVVAAVLVAVFAIRKKANQESGYREQIKEIEQEMSEEEEGTEYVLGGDLLTQISMIDKYLDDNFLYDVDIEDLRTGMLEGMIDALDDPYAEYYSGEELESFYDSTEGEYVGIGAAVTQELSTGIVRISKPYAGTPSAEAGLLPGDVVVSVDGTEVTGMELTQVVSLIKGEEGTDVVLEIYREEEGTYTDITVTRRLVILPTVESRMLEDNIGYIIVTGFEGVTAEQFESAYEELKAQGMERVIVDMRNNGGGLVDTVEQMVDYLLPEGTVFYVKYKDGTKDMEYVSDKKAALDIPMVVLVNENTASAAEIFSGNIQEFGMGTIVGTTTYGKGVMQQMFYTNLARTSAIKLTVADYYIHSDKNINGVGIIPDVEIELAEEVSKMAEIPLEQDNQLQKAIEIVKGR